MLVVVLRFDWAVNLFRLRFFLPVHDHVMVRESCGRMVRVTRARVLHRLGGIVNYWMMFVSRLRSFVNLARLSRSMIGMLGVLSRPIRRVLRWRRLVRIKLLL